MIEYNEVVSYAEKIKEYCLARQCYECSAYDGWDWCRLYSLPREYVISELKGNIEGDRS